MRKEVLKKLKDPKFTFELMSLEDESKVKELFANEGIDINETERDEIAQIINEVINQLRKIPEDELKSISGGDDPESFLGKWFGNIVGAILRSSATPDFLKSFFVTSRVDKAKIDADVEMARIKADSNVQMAKYAAGAIAVSAVSLGVIYGAYSLKKWYSKNKSKAQ